MQSEIGNLIEEIKENILFLQELGVTGLQADLTAFKTSQNPAATAVKEEPKREWAAPPPKTEVPKNVPDTGKAPVRSMRETLEAAKLSNFSSSKEPVKPREDRPQYAAKNTEPEKESTMNDSMFGDITPSIKLAPTTETIEDIHRSIEGCKMCRLHEGRTQIVNSTGNLKAKLMFIGEAPGADEDAQGKPFVGRAGQLLTKIIEAMGLSRDEVFIGNINRCRPPGNRQPAPDEASTCKPYLLREIAVVRPEVIVVLGATAMQNLLETKVPIGKVRGQFQDYHGVKVMPTFHPAYLLRDPHKKREVWEDMKKVKAVLDALP